MVAGSKEDAVVKEEVEEGPPRCDCDRCPYSYPCFIQQRLKTRICSVKADRL